MKGLIRKMVATACLGASLLATVPTSAAVLAEWRFTSGGEGWSGGNFVWHSEGGNPGGCFGAPTDIGGFSAVATPQPLGDQSAAYGGRLTLDYFGSIRGLTLRSTSDIVIYIEMDSSASSWTTLSIPLSPAGGWAYQDGSPATETQIRDVLRSLRFIAVGLDVGTGFTGIDNVALFSPALYIQSGSFRSPVDSGAVNDAKAGQIVPIVYRLVDASGVPISDPAHFGSVSSQPSSGSCGGLPSEAIETSAGGSGLQYLGDGRWQFNWKTPKSYADQCRTMTLSLSDGTTLAALFRFR